MKISDLKLIIENPSGSYKKFADSLDEYPILGVTYPTHYGYVEGFASEDGHDLDVFIGNGTSYGFMQVRRDEIKGGIETKFFFGVSQAEIKSIKEQFRPVIAKIKTFNQTDFLNALQKFKRIKASQQRQNLV